MEREVLEHAVSSPATFALRARSDTPDLSPSARRGAPPYVRKNCRKSMTARRKCLRWGRPERLRERKEDAFRRGGRCRPTRLGDSPWILRCGRPTRARNLRFDTWVDFTDAENASRQVQVVCAIDARYVTGAVELNEPANTRKRSLRNRVPRSRRAAQICSVGALRVRLLCAASHTPLG